MQETTSVPKLKKQKVVLQKVKSTAGTLNNIIKSHKFYKNKKVFYPSLILSIVILYYVINSLFKTTTSDVPTYKVNKEKFLVTITESGEIRALNSTSITAPRVRGNIKIVYLIPEGTFVDSGDTVVQFDPAEAVNNLKDAEAKLEIAISERDKVLANHKSSTSRVESELRSAELSFELSKLNLEQMKFEAEIKQREAKLNHQKNELSYNKVKQDLESQKIINQSELNKVNIDVQQRRSDLEKAKKDLEMLTLTAPQPGLVVYEMNWNTGRKVTIGDAPWSGMTIVSLPDLSAMESVTFVNEVDVSRVKKGLPVEIRLDAFRDSAFFGEISSVASLGKTKDNSQIKVFEILVSIKSKSDILKPGMTSSNKIIINEIPNSIVVPQEAVFEKENKKIVYVKNGSSFEEREITVGEKSENYILVKKGLEAGDEVALRDPYSVVDESDESGTTSTIQQPELNKK
ncbi:MAG TPA: efflux RND transporter periplasmic adaptor subunit [Ignavibacteriaceae bacterium]|nr:efflux RND transporter periplasmic adaptor subunit [Ignavibacteriaceae bacterium]